jgi:hypothetical protein
VRAVCIDCGGGAWSERMSRGWRNEIPLHSRVYA